MVISLWVRAVKSFQAPPPLLFFSCCRTNHWSMEMFKQNCPSATCHYDIPSFLTYPAPPALCRKAPLPDGAARQSWLLRRMPRLPVAQPRSCRKMASWGQGRVRNQAETEQELPRFLPQPVTETGTPGSPCPRNTGSVTPKDITTWKSIKTQSRDALDPKRTHRSSWESSS